MKKSVALGLCTLALIALSASPLYAIVAGGQTYFLVVPRLVRATTTNVSASYRIARYSFTVSVPSDSGEPLGALSVGIPAGIYTPYPGEVSVVDATGARLATQTTAQSDGSLLITFQQPVDPGSTVTVQFEPIRNPKGGGTYLFEVRALPAGTNPFSYFLGFGRLEFFVGGAGSSG